MNSGNGSSNSPRAASAQGPSIFGYSDYRLWLADYYTFRKALGRGFSFRAFSKAAGFQSPNVLKLVIDGQRNIGNDALDQFCQGLGLTGESRDYFKTLVALNQSSHDEEKQELLRKLNSLLPHSRRRDLSEAELKYLSHWLYPVLRELVSLVEFREDPYWISRRLNGKTTSGEVSSALAFLQENGFLKRDDTGRLQSCDALVITSDEVKSLAIRNYHRQMMDQAKETLETLPITMREFGALTMILPQDAVDELKERMKVFRRDLHTWAMEKSTAAQPDTIVQVNLQMYPHTKKVAG